MSSFDDARGKYATPSDNRALREAVQATDTLDDRAGGQRPPAHIVINAVLLSERSSSCRAVVINRLPVHPSGMSQRDRTAIDVDARHVRVVHRAANDSTYLMRTPR